MSEQKYYSKQFDGLWMILALVWIAMAIKDFMGGNTDAGLYAMVLVVTSFLLSVYQPIINRVMDRDARR